MMGSMLTKLLFGLLGGVTLLLGALYLYSAWASRAAVEAHPPHGRFVDVEGVRLHYLDVGTGPAIVLIHGASTTLQDFEASILPLLAKTYRVIAFDRPGYGYSSRPAGPWLDPARQARLLHEALLEIGVERSVLVGHSLGGAIVLAYALNHPQATAGVVLIGGAAYPWEGGVAWTNHVANLPVFGPLFASTLVFPLGQLLLDGAVKEVFAPNSPPPDYIERTGIVLALRPESFQASAEDVLRLSPYLEQQSHRYGTFAQPLLLITGDSDSVVPAWNHAHRLVRLLPQARLVELEATGHAPHHVHPEAVTTLITDFAAELGPRPHSAHASSSLSRRERSN